MGRAWRHGTMGLNMKEFTFTGRSKEKGFMYGQTGQSMKAIGMIIR